MKKKRSIKNVILLNLFVFSFIPMLILGILLFIYLFDSLNKSTISRHNAITETAKKQVEIYIQSSLGYLRQIQYGIDNGLLNDEDEINRDLDRILHSNSFFERILIINHQGESTHLAPFDTELLGVDLSGRDFYKVITGEEDVYWSETFISIHSNFPTIAVGLKIPRGAVVAYIQLKSLNDMISGIRVDSSGYALLTDKDGKLISYPDYSRVLRRDDFRSYAFISEGMSGNQGNYSLIFEEKPYHATTRLIAPTGWILSFLQSSGEVLRPLNRAWTLFLSTLLLSSLITLVIIFFRIRNLFSPIGILIENSRKITDGEFSLELPAFEYTEIDILGNNFLSMAQAVQRREQDLRGLNEKLQESLDEKMLLIQEIQHRVKNNISLLYGLISLQQDYVNEEKFNIFLEEVKNRINSIAIVHNLLYRSKSFLMIDFTEFIRCLGESILFSGSAKSHSLSIVYNLEQLSLNIEKAVPCGLIFNELFSNAIKHGYKDEAGGRIIIELKKEAEWIILSIKDFGAGIPPGEDIFKSENFGLKLVSMMCDQLRGYMSVVSELGTEFKVRFPSDKLDSE